MKIEPTKNPAVFPEFHLGNFKGYAARWAEKLSDKFEQIEVVGIYVCRLNTAFEERMRSRIRKERSFRP
jgi:hypothetical protein